jgi:AcrR family transcriptional regulator
LEQRPETVILSPVARPKLRDAKLREHVLERAVATLEHEGPSALRARHVASAAGTSTAALYELFGDKAGLVRALFYEGFRQLADLLDEVPVSEAPRAGVVALLAGSRRFAVERPMLFEVMYARPFGEFAPTPDDLRVAGRIYDLVVHRVGRWLSGVGASIDPVDAAHVLIALNRGLIASELAGILGRSDRSRERRWQLAVDAQLDGLAGWGR